MKRLILGLIIVIIASSCNNAQEFHEGKRDFSDKTFYLSKGTGIFQFGLGTWDFVKISQIGFRENGTGLMTVEVYKSEKETEFDWVIDEKRNWVKVTSINDKNNHLFFSYENDQLKSENTSEEFYFTNIEKLAIRNFMPKESWAVGHIKNSGVNLRMGPGTDFNKERYLDNDIHDSYIVDKKGDWYQIAVPYKDVAILFWVHKDYFIVTKKGIVANQNISPEFGDKKKPHGYKESGDYSGQGGLGNGISFSLGERGSLFLEQPSATFKEQGTVVVRIWVNRDGIVKKAQVSAKGTNVLDQNLRKIAVDAAYNSTFAKDNNAVELQRGTITYNFILSK